MFAVHIGSSSVALDLLNRSERVLTENRFSQYHKNVFNGRDFSKEIYLHLPDPRRGLVAILFPLVSNSCFAAI